MTGYWNSPRSDYYVTITTDIDNETVHARADTEADIAVQLDCSSTMPSVPLAARQLPSGRIKAERNFEPPCGDSRRFFFTLSENRDFVVFLNLLQEPPGEP